MAHGDITHIEIPVANTTASGALYADLFGWKISADSESQRNTVNKLVHLLTRRVETESLTRPIIELDHDCLNLCITDGIEISAFGVVITNETIEVFV